MRLALMRAAVTRAAIVAGLTLLSAAPAYGQRQPRPLGTFSVVANTVSAGVVQVGWQPVQKAAGYDVERCEGINLTTCAVKTASRIATGQPLQLNDNLTASGTYLYRVTAFGSNQLPFAQGQVGYQYTAPATAILMPPPTGTITPMPAGPSQVTAASPIPGQIRLSWSPVANAIGFSVFRSNSGGEVNRQIPGTGKDAYGNLITQMTDAPVDFRWTYSYTIYARIPSGSTEIRSAPGPVASAKSLPFVQVSGLTSAIVPSVRSPGRLDLTLRWNAVPGAEKYIVTDKDYSYVQGEISGAAAPVFTWVIGTKTSYTMCVGVQYPYQVRQAQTEPCVTIKT